MTGEQLAALGLVLDTAKAAPLPPGEPGTAWFSPCMRYRYVLTRTWDASKPVVVFLMLNPSTADAHELDATITRCQKRAVSWGMGGLTVLNIFAYRATKPKDMRAQADPVGPVNDKVLQMLDPTAVEFVVCAWGANGTFRGRGIEVAEMMRARGHDLRCLRLTKGDRMPEHPLLLSYSLQPESFTA